MSSALHGIKIIPHPFAREVRDEWRVERHPIPKRRRQWRVVKHHIDRPGCLLMGGVFYMHPDLIAKLPRTTP
jgi:hypothetical protein